MKYDMIRLDCANVMVHVQKGMRELMGVSAIVCFSIAAYSYCCIAAPKRELSMDIPPSYLISLLPVSSYTLLLQTIPRCHVWRVLKVVR